MDKKTNRREILKAVAAIPISLAAAPARAFQQLIPETSGRPGRLLAKIDAESLKTVGAVVHFDADRDHSSNADTASGASAQSAFATRLESGEIVAYNGDHKLMVKQCHDKICIIDLRER